MFIFYERRDKYKNFFRTENEDQTTAVIKPLQNLPAVLEKRNAQNTKSV